jgi:sortase A
LKLFGRILTSSGLVLLALWALAQLHSSIGSSVALAQFASSAATQSSRLTADDGSPVDTSLWSDKRVEAFRESLGIKLDPPVAVLRIPRIAMQVPVFRGVDDLTLNRGAGLIAGTAEPGTAGNAGIAAHRDGFFRGLKDVATGDVIELQVRGGVQKYVVKSVTIVQPENLSVFAPTAEPTLTLVTCYPFYFVGSAPQRFIVRAVREVDASARELAAIREAPNKPSVVNRKSD